MTMVEEYLQLASLARDKAREAIARESPVGAREWLEVAHVADVEARAWEYHDRAPDEEEEGMAVR